MCPAGCHFVIGPAESFTKANVPQMSGADARQEQRVPPLFFSFASLGRWFASALSLALGFGLFHRLLDFSSSLGAGLGALLTLFLLQGFAAEQFDERFVGAVASLPGSTNDAQISAVAIAEARSHVIEQFGNGIACHQIRRSLTAGRKITTLAQGNHLFYLWAHGFGFGQSGLDSLLHNEGRYQVAQQGAAMGGVTA